MNLQDATFERCPSVSIRSSSCVTPNPSVGNDVRFVPETRMKPKATLRRAFISILDRIVVGILLIGLVVAGGPLATAAPALRGDLDLDGRITLVDATLELRAAIGVLLLDDEQTLL